MNGIVIVNKPLGKTSHDIVNFVRRLTGVKKVGHTGTLDPDAEGVLPVCIGNATKIADMLTLSDKEYVTELVLGMTTDTQDAEGEVLTECAVNVSEDEICRTVLRFVGEIHQIPPMYSAIKQDGKKLYELARKGITVERPSRRVVIYKIEILNIDMQEFTVKLRVQCSKGTYIRTLCEDIGTALGVGAYMNRLQRTRTGPFTLEDSWTMQELSKMQEEHRLADALKSTDRMFLEYPAIVLNEKQERSVRNGMQMTYRGLTENQCYRVYGINRAFLCLSRCQNGRLKLEKSFW